MLLTLGGHAELHCKRLLSGVKRTWRVHCEKSAYDPKRTWVGALQMSAFDTKRSHVRPESRTAANP
jgi:hypothetical protein